VHVEVAGADYGRVVIHAQLLGMPQGERIEEIDLHPCPQQSLSRRWKIPNF